MTNSFVDPELSNPKRVWNEYFEAKVGFRNYWYPACMSGEAPEGEVLVRKILGEDILLRRVRGQVRAIRDRCIHRGAKFSDKVECYTPETITCFYHGATFNWTDGTMETLFGAPESGLIGKKKIKTYPIEEVNGMVFIFIGDEDYVPPPLSKDVPPEFLGDNIALEGSSIVVKANWRLGPEGGIDEVHRYLHRESPLLLYSKKSMPLGHAHASGQLELVEEEGEGPRGIIDRFKPEKMFFDGVIGGKVVVSAPDFGVQPEVGGRKRTLYTSIWLPACLKVVGFPDYGMMLFEWYVPIDETTHRCFMTFTKVCETPEEAAEFKEDYHLKWKPLAVDGFLMQDAMARESVQNFYQHDRAWLMENLVEADVMLMEWRKLCSRNSRGVQKPEHLV